MKKKSKREFGSLRDLPSGMVQASYKIGGRTIYNPKAFHTNGEARNWLATEQYKLITGYAPTEPPRVKSLSFSECASEYLSLKTNMHGRPLSPSYVAKCQSHISGKLATFAEVPIADITTKMVEAWWVKETGRGHMASTSNAYRFLRAVLRKAIRDGDLLGANPCQISGAGSAKTGIELTAPTEEEMRKIISQAPRQLSMYLTLSFVAALRFEEATALRIRDVIRTSENGRVRYALHISRSVSRVGGNFIIGPTKSEAGNRVTHLPSSIYGQLENYIETLGSDSNSLLFPSSRTGSYMHNSVLNKQLRRACKSAGITDKHFTLHSLRRGGATALAEKGGTTAEVQALLGDSSFAAALLYVKTTSRLDSLLEKIDVCGVSQREHG